MKNVNAVLLVIVFSASFIYAQNRELTGRSCSVICLDDQWIPTSYKKDAACEIDRNTRGIISVHETNDVNDQEDYNRLNFIRFRIAIFKESFDSIISFSEKSYTKIEAQEILKECEPGDKIMILLVNADRYSLPHHSIKVI